MYRKNFYFDVIDENGHTKLCVEIRSPAKFSCEDLRIINDCVQSGSIRFVRQVYKCKSLSKIIKTLLVSKRYASTLFIIDNSRWSINEIKKLVGIINSTPKIVGWLISNNYRNTYTEYVINTDSKGCLYAKEM